LRIPLFQKKVKKLYVANIGISSGVYEKVGIIVRNLFEKTIFWRKIKTVKAIWNSVVIVQVIRKK